jgi:hypothetical protein
MGNMKRYIGWSAIFLLGMIVGVFSTLHLERRVRPTLVKMIQTGLKVEQEYLASRAAREDRQFEAAIHRWVAANAASETGFCANQTHYNGDTILLLPSLIVFEKMFENAREGQLIAEGIDRGKLAVSLEAIGENGLAEVEWARAHSLMKRKSIEDTKMSVYGLLKQEDTDLYQRAESAVLGAR